MGENLKAFLAEFSTLSLTILPNSYTIEEFKTRARLHPLR